MSTQYRFVDLKKKEAVQKFNEELKSIESNCREAFENIPVPNWMEDVKDYYLEKITMSGLFHGYENDEDHLVIGTSLYTGFSWRKDNGFCDIHTVKRFLDNHPGYVIEDEYGRERPFDEFVAIFYSWI